MKLKRFKSVGHKEMKAASKVINSGVLSDFIASKGKSFLGGKYVKNFEKKICKFYNSKFAITTNSWTSGLICAIGALDIEPGDEIICSPWTMSASAISILHWNAIPVLVDINYKTFQLDLNQVKKNISNKTKAIIAVDIFGRSENIFELKKIAKKYNLKIISDSAQSPYTFYKNKLAGTQTDIGGFSLNCHKHINTGEGGILVTNSRKFAERMRLIRNHAENSLDDLRSKKKLSNMIGYNFRLGEIESAIGIEQLKKLKKIVIFRQKLAKILIKNLNKINGLILPNLNKYETHSFYVFPIILDDKILKHREKIFQLLTKHGVPGLMKGYINLATLPIFKNKIAYGTKGFPWKYFNSKVNYNLKKFKNTNKLNQKSFIGIQLCAYDFKEIHMKKIAYSFIKVWKKLKL